MAQTNLGTERGSVAIQIGLTMTVIIGMLALGIEMTFLLYKQRQMQSAADSAALGGATALSTGHPADLTLEARAIAASLGFVSGAEGVSVVVNNPPVGGSHAGDNKYVEAIISQPQTLSMVTLFRSGLFNVGARAVAYMGETQGDFCVLSLVSSSFNNAVTASGGAHANLNNCSLGVYSTSNSSINASGGSTEINARRVVTRGRYVASGGATINVDVPPILINQPLSAMPSDPYGGLTVPTPELVTTSCSCNSGTRSCAPDTYYGISATNTCRLTLQPGTFIITNQGGTRRDLTVSNSARLTGNGVTIILTGTTANLVGRVNFNGGAASQINISAPLSGSWAGIALFQNRIATANNANTFNATQVINGAIYMPNGRVSYNGNSGVGADCTQLLAYSLAFTGTSSLQLNCADMPVQPIGSTGGGKASLVE